MIQASGHIEMVYTQNPPFYSGEPRIAVMTDGNGNGWWGVGGGGK